MDLIKNQKTCSYCGVLLEPHQPSHYCSKPACKLEWHKQKQEETKTILEAAKSSYALKVKTVVSQWLSKQKKSPGRINVVEIPHTGLSCESVDEQRLQQFVEYLRYLLESEDDFEEEVLYRAPVATPVKEELIPIAGELCAMCRGKCCSKGKQTHAFIQRATIERVRQKFSELTNDEIVDKYLSFIPELVTGNSCIYHSPKGCTLPKDFRADVCSDFYCLNLVNYIALRNKKLPIDDEYDVFVIEDEYKNSDLKLLSTDLSVEVIPSK